VSTPVRPTRAARAQGIASVARSARRAAAPVLDAVSLLGWTVLAAGIALYLAGNLLGWAELRFMAALCLILLALCALMTIGRSQLSVELEVRPQRVIVGQPATGRLSVSSRSKRPLLPVTLEVPIGTTLARFTAPPLGPGAEHTQAIALHTARRGVTVIGPATTVRGDPFGFFRRAYAWAKPVELYVHPITAPLEPLGAGLLRDLEGQTTNDLSMSDLAFHALREYAPGDDRRYIHWRSSAKASASRPGTFLIRQFLDTRRSHITVLVDGRAGSYRGEDEFELAISVGASIATRALRDDLPTTVLACDQMLDDSPSRVLLDTFARAKATERTLASMANSAVQAAPDTSTAFMVTGGQLPFSEVQRAASHFPPEVQVITLQVNSQKAPTMTVVRGMPVLSIRALTDLAAVLRAVVAQ
jgi:hypothetical protein